ncbi:hypothetical protein F4781DRAFT_97211 [Annulohypoxylon bovei var. microspora]|nr:hypothetical protein F4781DRAFT_97211 [Annulohypoxylon bovei var. microspora]
MRKYLLGPRARFLLSFVPPSFWRSAEIVLAIFMFGSSSITSSSFYLSRGLFSLRPIAIDPMVFVPFTTTATPTALLPRATSLEHDGTPPVAALTTVWIPPPDCFPVSINSQRIHSWLFAIP